MFMLNVMIVSLPEKPSGYGYTPRPYPPAPYGHTPLPGHPHTPADHAAPLYDGPPVCSKNASDLVKNYCLVDHE